MLRVGTLIAAAIGSVVLLAVGVGLYLPGFNDGGGRLTQGQVLIELASHVRQIKPRDAFVTYRANVPLSASSSLEASIPDIDRFPLNVNPPANTGDVVAEFFSSAEKAGKDTDGWLVAVAEGFNTRNVKLASGRTAKVKIRYIPSGTAFQFIASGKYKLDAFTPSSHLWLRMVEARGVPLTPVSEKLVSNLAGIVMKSSVAATVKSAGGTVDIKNLIDAVSQGNSPWATLIRSPAAPV